MLRFLFAVIFAIYRLSHIVRPHSQTNHVNTIATESNRYTVINSCASSCNRERALTDLRVSEYVWRDDVENHNTERAFGMGVRVYIYSSVQDACRSCVSVSVYKLLYFFFLISFIITYKNSFASLCVAVRARLQAASGFSNVMERRKKKYFSVVSVSVIAAQACVTQAKIMRYLTWLYRF